MSDLSSSELVDPNARRRDMTEIVGVVAAAAAVFVGGLYSIGAVLIAGDLRDTNVAVRDALPLIPLPQLLGRGMSVLLGSFGPVLVVVALLAVTVWLAGKADREKNVPSHHRRRMKIEDLDTEGLTQADIEDLTQQIAELNAASESRRVASLRSRRILTVGVVVTGVVCAFLMPPAAALLVLASGGAAALGVAGVVTIRTGTVLSFALLLLGGLLVAYQYPHGLAQVRVTTDTNVIVGKLIAQTGDAFYVANITGDMTAIPTSRVQTARVISAPKPNTDATYKRVWNRVR